MDLYHKHFNLPGLYNASFMPIILCWFSNIGTKTYTSTYFLGDKRSIQNPLNKIGIGSYLNRQI